MHKKPEMFGYIKKAAQKLLSFICVQILIFTLNHAVQLVSEIIIRILSFIAD